MDRIFSRLEKLDEGKIGFRFPLHFYTLHESSRISALCIILSLLKIYIMHSSLIGQSLTNCHETIEIYPEMCRKRAKCDTSRVGIPPVVIFFRFNSAGKNESPTFSVWPPCLHRSGGIHSGAYSCTFENWKRRIRSPPTDSGLFFEYTPSARRVHPCTRNSHFRLYQYNE